MSRIIIKNIPKTCSKDKICQLLKETGGDITDISVKFSLKNNNALYAFAGFKTEVEAQHAISFLNQTFINSNKILVELCNSKNIHKSDGNNEIGNDQQNQNEEDELLKKHENEEYFNEFLSVHKISSSLGQKNDHLQSKKKQKSGKVETEETPKDDQSDQQTNKKILWQVKLTNLPFKCKKKDIKDFLKPTTPFSMRIPRKIPGIAYVGYKTEKGQKIALLKDKNILGGKQICVKNFTPHEVNTITNNNAVKTNKEDIAAAVEEIGNTGKIFMRNLPYVATAQEIESLFAEFGTIAEFNLPVDSDTQKMKGFGTVTFLIPDQAVEAYKKLDGSSFCGRILHLLPGKDTSVNTQGPDNSNLPFRVEKELKKKNNMTTSSWNALFIGDKAITETIADMYNISKEELLDPHKQSVGAGVRMALGETQIVAETRKFLEAEGVFLDAFNNKNVKRSKSIIIAKNLPFKTDHTEIRQLFQKYGSLYKVILPPHGTTALVAFEQPSEAQKAFRCLSYSKFKDLPLYLEWAPENTITNTQKIDVQPTNAVLADSSNVIVKNLDSKITREKLNQHLSSCGEITNITIMNAPESQTGNYAIVKFAHKHGAEKALNSNEYSKLDGICLKLESEDEKLNQKKTHVQPTDKSTTKIIAKNVPFQANIKEIRDLFSTFGELKAARLPKKAGGDLNAHRGFGFVEYTNEIDAQKAFEALSRSTHLYGRRLVLEWASAREDIDQIRKRNADHFGPVISSYKKQKAVFSVNE